MVTATPGAVPAPDQPAPARSPLLTPAAATRASAGSGGTHWRRSQWGMSAVVFIAFFGFNFVMPILPLYVRQLGVTDVSQAALITGVMLSISPLLAAVFAPLWGLVADRYGRKRMVQRSLVVFVVACTLMGLVHDVWQLFLLRAAIGVFGGFTAMTLAYTVAVAPPHKASAALGMNQAAQVAGVIVGPLCAGFIGDHYGLRASFFVGAAVCAAGIVVLTLLTQDDRALRLVESAQPVQPRSSGGAPPDAHEANPPRPPAGAPEASSLRALGAAARLPGFGAVMAILFLAQFVDRSFGPILPLYVGALGTPPNRVASYAGLIISAAAVGTGVSASLLGHLAARLPVQRLLLATLVLGVGLCFPMALVQTPLQLLIIRAALGLCAGGTLTLAYSLANQVAPPESKGAAFGVLSSTALLGSASSPLVIGALTRLDMRAAFGLDSMLYAVALVWALRAAGIRPQPGSSAGA